MPRQFYIWKGSITGRLYPFRSVDQYLPFTSFLTQLLLDQKLIKPVVRVTSAPLHKAFQITTKMKPNILVPKILTRSTTNRNQS